MNPPIRKMSSLRMLRGPADELVHATPAAQEAGILARRKLVAGVRQVVRDRLDEPPRPRAEHGDRRREGDGLLDVVRHEDHRLLEGAPETAPQARKPGARPRVEAGGGRVPSAP